MHLSSLWAGMAMAKIGFTMTTVYTADRMKGADL
jgi:hypothetical protein